MRNSSEVRPARTFPLYKNLFPHKG